MGSSCQLKRWSFIYTYSTCTSEDRYRRGTPSRHNQIHHRLIPPCTTGPCSGLLWGQGRPRPTAEGELYLVPNLNNNRRHPFLPDVSFNILINERDSVPGESGLIVSLAQEVGVKDGGDQRVSEGDGTQKDSGHNQKLGVCHSLHCGVIVGWGNGTVSDCSAS